MRDGILRKIEGRDLYDLYEFYQFIDERENMYVYSLREIRRSFSNGIPSNVSRATIRLQL